MKRYVIKRLLLFPVLLLIVSALIFFLVNLVPIDPVRSILPPESNLEDMEALRQEMGLNDPLIVQYFNYMKGVFQGDFGKSWYTGKSVIAEVQIRMPVTVKLSVLTMVITVLVGLPLGILCAVKQYTAVDDIINAVSKCLGVIPNFWMALILMLFFCSQLHLLPSYGIGTWRHWILPVATLSVQIIATYLRVVRSTMLDCIRQDFIRTARAKGQKERVIIFGHALKNALLPLITLTGQQFAILMGGALVVESVFSLPGLGSFVINAIKTKDIPLVVGGTLFIALIFLLVTLIMDILYVVVDPRVKSTFVSAKKMRENPQEAI